MHNIEYLRVTSRPGYKMKNADHSRCLKDEVRFATNKMVTVTSELLH